MWEVSVKITRVERTWSENSKERYTRAKRARAGRAKSEMIREGGWSRQEKR